MDSGVDAKLTDDLITNNVTSSFAALFAEPREVKIQGIDMLVQIQRHVSGAKIIATVKGFEHGVEAPLNEKILSKAQKKLERLVTATVADLVSHYHDSLIANAR